MAMDTMMRWRLAAAAMVLMLAFPAVAQTPPNSPGPPDPQGLIRERDQSRERLLQEQMQRNQVEQLNRDQAERAARQRLESGRLERMQAPQIVLPGSPPATTSVPQPGLTDPAAELRRSEEAKRQQLDYDTARARQGLDNSGSTIGLPGSWKPIGAR
jgi:hypothetical protein